MDQSNNTDGPSGSSSGITNGSVLGSSTTTKPRSSSMGLANISGFSTSSNKKTPMHVIQPANFIDTGAILILFNLMPSVCMMIVHWIFITMVIGIRGRNQVSIKSVLFDFLFAIVTLYLAPQLKHVVLVFAHAIVASSLGGGAKSFQNAIYTTLMVEFARLLTFSVDSDLDTRAATGSPNVLFAEQEFNTLTSVWLMIPNLISTFKRANWRHEFPMICFQVAAIHVIGLGMLPWIKKVFPERHPTTSSSNNDGYYWPVNNDEVHDDTNSRVISYSEEAESIDLGSDLNLLSTPKKNKRLATVRNNQPVWSTLASSMVLAARQESERIQRDEIEGLKNDDDDPDDDKVLGMCLVRFILDNVVAFEMKDFDFKLKDSFVVRVNGIQWPQVAIHSLDKMNEPFLVVIHGLTPMTQYNIEISCMVDDRIERLVVCQRVNVCTTLRKSSASSTSVAPSGPTTRPLSPVTTLLDTLATTNMRLSEEKARFKRSKKEHTKRLSSLRGEIDGIKSKIDSADKGDERNRRKLLSLREMARQHEEEVKELERQLDRVGEEEEDEADNDEELKSEHARHLHLAKEKSRAEQELRNSWCKTLADLESELGVLTSRREKLDAKIDRLKPEDPHSVKVDYKLDLDNEIERRKQVRKDKIDRRDTVRDEFSNSITKMENTILNTRQKTSVLYVKMQNLSTTSPPLDAADENQFYLQAQPPPPPPFGSSAANSTNVSPRESFS